LASQREFIINYQVFECWQGTTLLCGHTAFAGCFFSNNTRALEHGGQPALMGFPTAGA
jgi:hypothetical protein